VRTEVLVDFIRGIAARDAAALLASLDALVDEGHDLVHFWGEFVSVVRDLMLLRAWPAGTDALTRTPDEANALADAGSPLSLQDWTRVFQILAGLESGLKASGQPRFLFEGALIRMAGLGSVRPIEEILAGLGGAPVIPPAPVKSARIEPPRTPIRTAPLTRAEAAPIAPPPAPGGDVRAAISAAVTQARPMLGAMLERAAAITVDGGTLVVTFGAPEAGVRRVFVTDDNVRSVEAIAGQTLGRPVALRVEVSSPTDATGSAVSGPAGTVAEAVASPPFAGGADESRQALTERARKDPGVNRLLKEFGAQVVDVRPLRSGHDDAGLPPGVEENG
jgi:hypothetical protein